jgi:hypothetical protein
VDSQLDLARLARLQKLLGTELPEIVATLVAELATALRELDVALRSEDLHGAALAAHAARNSALMVGAGDLLNALRAVERGARETDLDTARAGFQEVQRSWPMLRGRLERLAREA